MSVKEAVCGNWGHWWRNVDTDGGIGMGTLYTNTLLSTTF